ncbi:histidine-type phosphatase [Krasilnikovia sp. MM14-A1259]|uniref:histidine-type phosphatase n=1 Tax=Krasilnikovia sp. MM14-A1259 TaxID=3373539 RepID=UPI0037F9FFA7
MKSTLAVAATALAAVLAGAPAFACAEAHNYTTKTPYAPQQSPRQYEPAPRGFAPIFTENVARHGSRAMSDSKDGDAVLAALATGQARHALTELGAELGPQVQALLAGAQTIGYGNLSGRGRREQAQTAQRLERRLPSLFDTIVAQQEPIEVLTSGVTRATDSANAFTGGLTAGDPALASLIQAPVTNKDLLYFHKQPQNAAYQQYVASDPDLHAVLARIDGLPQTSSAAARVVSRIFAPPYVAAMSDGDRIAFARSLFELSSAAPGLAVEAAGVDLDPFMSDADAQWFAYLDDAEEFYEKGPAFAGRSITYDMASVLLNDLFAQVDNKINNRIAYGAVLRFTHAEEVIPLAVLLGLPGSTTPAVTTYRYANNPWRGASVAPMGANIQWDVYAGHGRHLVRMLYNERETAFKSGCRPIKPRSYFYDFDELRRCYAIA